MDHKYLWRWMQAEVELEIIRAMRISRLFSRSNATSHRPKRRETWDFTAVRRSRTVLYEGVEMEGGMGDSERHFLRLLLHDMGLSRAFCLSLALARNCYMRVKK